MGPSVYIATLSEKSEPLKLNKYSPDCLETFKKCSNVCGFLERIKMSDRNYDILILESDDFVNVKSSDFPYSEAQIVQKMIEGGKKVFLSYQPSNNGGKRAIYDVLIKGDNSISGISGTRDRFHFYVDNFMPISKINPEIHALSAVSSTQEFSYELLVGESKKEKVYDRRLILLLQ